MDCKNILEKFKSLICAVKRAQGRSDERTAWEVWK
jgi:hypothetical protein